MSNCAALSYISHDIFPKVGTPCSSSLHYSRDDLCGTIRRKRSIRDVEWQLNV